MRCKMRNQPIAFLDSGVGGLSVVKEVMRELPNENILFIGDTARNPYGNRKKEEVIQFTRELSSFLVNKGIKMLVIACNTATALALDHLKKEFDIPIIGVIEPGSRSAVEASKNGEIYIIGTVRTIESCEYQKHIHTLNPNLKVQGLAIPEFVEMVENNELSGQNAENKVREELKPLKNTQMDTLVLACTHYPLLANLIQAELGQEIQLVDPAIASRKGIKNYLLENNLLNNENEKFGQAIFYTTAEKERFGEIARKWIPNRRLEIREIDLEELNK